jgi:hypothetical protein
MFERGDPASSDLHLSHIYGLALPLLKRGMPVTPVQLENLTVPHYLESFRLLLLTYQGMKPLTADVHGPLAEWVKGGGALVVVDDDSDPFNSVQEWWNSGGQHYQTPREHLFEQLRVSEKALGAETRPVKVGKGAVVWLRENPARLAAGAEGDERLVGCTRTAGGAVGLNWRETNYLLLRRGPYVLTAGLEESVAGAAKVLAGRFVNLFDSELAVRTNVTLVPASRFFLLDLDRAGGDAPRVLASACKLLPTKADQHTLSLEVEGVAETPAVVLIYAPPGSPRSVTLGGQPLEIGRYSAGDHLVWLHFANQSVPRELRVEF